MAERRMFAKSIVLSDAFLDMPMSARCLYFTLAMFADDDGFVNNPKSIMRQCGASAGDMETLSTKKFVIFFDNGVLVIKHWRIHNYIQNDRYQKTKYLDEMNSLYVGDDKIYHVKNSTEEQLELPFCDEGTSGEAEENHEDLSMYPECIQPVSKMDTQYSIDKDSIGKDKYNNACAQKKESASERAYRVNTEILEKYISDHSFNDAETESIKNWLEYKAQKDKKPYTDIGMKGWLTEVENNIKRVGSEPVVNQIQKAISSGWQGINLDKLQIQKKEPTFIAY